MSAFTPNIPAASDRPSSSQSQIQSNFNAIQDDLNKNHVAISDTANRGKHKFVEMPVGSLPTGLSSGEVTLYSKTVTQAELFMTRGVTGVEIQLTAGANASVPTIAANGVTFIPGGLLLQWGTGTTNASGNATISFSPSFTTFYSATLTRVETGADNRGFIQFGSTPGAGSASVKMRDSNGNGIAGTLYWMAIGLA
jgi:hypothetical protein